MARRVFLTIIILLIGSASLSAAPTAGATDASVFMNELWHSAVEVLTKKAPLSERLARFRQLFQSDFDGPGIARFVLGRYWRSASEQEQQGF
jgi:phospholipid transport system substrate-binding protein